MKYVTKDNSNVNSIKGILMRSTVIVLSLLFMAVLSGCTKEEESKPSESLWINESVKTEDSTAISVPPAEIVPPNKPAAPPTDADKPGSGNDGAAVNNGDSTEPPKPPVVEQNYDFALPVPESEIVSDDYFDDAIFIGNSRTVGFGLYCGLDNLTVYAQSGISVTSLFTTEAVDVNGKKLTIIDAVKANPNFKKVYIMLGLNELGWVYSDIFIEKYVKVLDVLKEINPEAIIYVQSILPVSAKKSSIDPYENMPRINEYNKLIKIMCEDEQVFFLDVADIMTDEEGFLFADAAFDGTHLKSEYCVMWLDYLKCHVVE